MAIKFFGQYLLEKNIIKPSELIDAVKYQESKNIKLGEYALSKCYINEKDLERIQNEQKNVVMRFGRLAVKLNILTPEQIEEILTMQKNDRLLIGEALVGKGFLTREILERELALFKEDQSKYATGEIITPEGIKNTETVKDIVDLTQKLIQHMTGLNIKVGEGFISENEPQKNFLLILVSLYGNLNYDYALALPKEISELIVSAVIGKDVKNEPSEFITDGVKEFCNIVCGNILAKLSEKGKNMDIAPPEEIVFTDDGYHLVKGRKSMNFPIIFPEQESTLILIEDE
ncbi:MAG: chemotaxis protein CheX [Candidatus Mariimomonas ferrooxydans]